MNISNMICIFWYDYVICVNIFLCRIWSQDKRFCESPCTCWISHNYFYCCPLFVLFFNSSHFYLGKSKHVDFKNKWQPMYFTMGFMLCQHHRRLCVGILAHATDMEIFQINQINNSVWLRCCDQHLQTWVSQDFASFCRPFWMTSSDEYELVAVVDG